MKQIEKTQYLSLTCREGWLQLDCALPLPPLKRGLVVSILAAVTAWGGQD